MKLNYPILHQTNRGEIKIINHPIYGKLCIAQLHLGFELVKSFAKKHNSQIPTENQTYDLYERTPIEFAHTKFYL